MTARPTPPDGPAGSVALVQLGPVEGLEFDTVVLLERDLPAELG